LRELEAIFANQCIKSGVYVFATSFTLRTVDVSAADARCSCVCNGFHVDKIGHERMYMADVSAALDPFT
jgi:hypothetical protein